MIEVWTWPTPNGHKVHIALEELGLPYKVIPINIGKGDQFKPEFLAITPNHRIPAIVDPDGPGGKPLKLFESAAIMIYLSEKTGGKLIPQDPVGRYTLPGMDDVPDGRHRPDVRPVQPLRQLRGGKDPLRHRRATPTRCAAAPRAGQAAGGGHVARRRRIQHGRHHHLPVDPQSGPAQHRSRRLPEREALARRDRRAAGGAARLAVLAENQRKGAMTDAEREVMFGKTQFAVR